MFSNNRKEELPPRPNVPLGNLRTFSTFTGQLWNTVSSRFDSILNCNKIWNDFRLDKLGGPHSSDRRRYIRLNPELGFKVPKLNAVEVLRDIQQAAHNDTKTGTSIAQVKEVAHRLIASTFFFEKIDSSTREQEGSYECDGFICCRFHTGTEEMKALGQYIIKYMRGSFEPYFIVQEDRKHETAQKFTISEDILKEMYIRGKFAMERVHVTVSKQLSRTAIYLCLQEGSYPHSADSNLPLSGFPRTLMTEDLTQTPLPHTPRNSGSFKKRPHRRRRLQIPKTSSSTESASDPPPLRRVKSQSNLKRQSNLKQNHPKTPFPRFPRRCTSMGKEAEFS